MGRGYTLQVQLCGSWKRLHSLSSKVGLTCIGFWKPILHSSAPNSLDPPICTEPQRTSLNCWVLVTFCSWEASETWKLLEPIYNDVNSTIVLKLTYALSAAPTFLFSAPQAEYIKKQIFRLVFTRPEYLHVHRYECTSVFHNFIVTLWGDSGTCIPSLHPPPLLVCQALR